MFSGEQLYFSICQLSLACRSGVCADPEHEHPVQHVTGNDWDAARYISTRPPPSVKLWSGRQIFSILLPRINIDTATNTCASVKSV